MHIPRLVSSVTAMTLAGILVRAAFPADGQLPKSDRSPDRISIGQQEVWGDATNGLKPWINISPSQGGWDVLLWCIAVKDWPGRSWLKTTNRVGAELELWQSNGAQLVSKNPDVLAAFHLPKQTTVSDIILHSPYPRHMRGYQWWSVTRTPIKAGSGAETGKISLQSAFKISVTNDYVLRIVPLLYRVDTNMVAAHLVEFPAIKIKLEASGRVENIDDK